MTIRQEQMEDLMNGNHIIIHLRLTIDKVYILKHGTDKAKARCTSWWTSNHRRYSSCLVPVKTT